MNVRLQRIGSLILSLAFSWTSLSLDHFLLVAASLPVSLSDLDPPALLWCGISFFMIVQVREDPLSSHDTE